MRKPSTAVALIGLLCLICSFSFAESIFPPLMEVFGISVPFIEKCVDSSKENSLQLKDGRYSETYQQIYFTDYDVIGRCFGKSGFSLTADSFTDNKVYLTVRKENREVELIYDPVKYSLQIIYPIYYTEDRKSYSISQADPSVFPDIEELVGPIMPRLSAVLFRKPDSSSQNLPGSLVETYNSFSKDDYQLVSKYLQEQGCTVVGYSKDGNMLSITLEKNGNRFLMKYDPIKQTAVIEYNDIICIEPVATSTPAPTATPKPTVSPEEYDTYAALAVGILKGSLLNPESMQVHSIRVMGYEGDTYIVVDYSGMNRLGGYNRETSSFKINRNYISLSGGSADDDIYEKHQNQFYLIETLNVDDILKLL